MGCGGGGGGGWDKDCPISPWGLPGIQTGPDSRGARPRPRAHGRNRRPHSVVGHPVCPS